ncbi:MAG TPA: hypothetical protein VKZ49_12905 [Polyangiaceae bacterium]|nr:hypothetical protein [Polyangiaceae bacterium]
MNPLTKALLALAITHAPPARSPFSLEPMPACGSDPAAPTCELEPVCAEPNLSCRPPHYSKALKTWVRYESRESAVRRYAEIAEAIATTAGSLMKCKDESCEQLTWPGGTRTLALATLTVALHESGLREDVQIGRTRGSAGEACLVQVMPEQAPYYASWLPEPERELTAKDPKLREQFAQTLVGRSPEALSRCFEVGMRMLARARLACGSHPKGWQWGTFSMYGTGNHCSSPQVGATRSRTFEILLSTEPRLRPADAALVGLTEPPPSGGEV